jgi:biopolymer transport protein TolR
VNPSVVNLPRVSKASTAPQNPVEVVVYSDNRLAIKTKGQLQSVDMPSLIANVKGAQAGESATPVIISADKDARYEQVVNVMRRLQQADVQRVGLALQIERNR